MLGHLQNIYSTIALTLKHKTTKETSLKFYKVMVIPPFVFDYETWTLDKGNWNNIKTAKIYFLVSIKGCSKT